MHTGFTYRSVLSRSTCRVHPIYLIDYSIIVLTPFHTAYSFSGRFALPMSGHAYWHRGWCPFSLHVCEESRGMPGIFLIFGVWIVHICMTVWINSNFKFAQVPYRIMAFHLIHLLTSEKQAMLTDWNLAIIIHHSLLNNNIEIDDIIWIIILNLYNIHVQ